MQEITFYSSLLDFGPEFIQKAPLKLTIGSFHAKWSRGSHMTLMDFDEILYEHSHMFSMNTGKVSVSEIQYFRRYSHLFKTIAQLPIVRP